MPTHYLDFELGKIYYEDLSTPGKPLSPERYETYEYYKNNIIHTVYETAISYKYQQYSYSVGLNSSWRHRNVIRNVLKGNFAVTDGTVKAIQGNSYIVDVYYVSWDIENIIQLNFGNVNPPYKLNSDQADYGWWDDDNFSITSTIKSKIATKTISGKSYDYTYKNLGDSQYQFKEKSADSYDPLTGITDLEFTDKTIAIDVDIEGVFDQVTGLNTDSGKMFRLYNAAFARFPDADGLKYWIGNFSSGIDDERAVSSSFLASAEFKQRYGENITHETYVQNLYLNVLNRELDQGGYDYWVGNLNNGIEQRHEVLLGFSESAENKLLFTEMTGFA